MKIEEVPNFTRRARELLDDWEYALLVSQLWSRPAPDPLPGTGSLHEVEWVGRDGGPVWILYRWDPLHDTLRFLYVARERLTAMQVEALRRYFQGRFG